MRAAVTLGIVAFLGQAITAASAQDVVRDAAGADGSSGSGRASGGEAARVLALSSDLAYGEYLAGECASCHAADPAAQEPDSTVPIIHGAEAPRIARALLEYRSGVRSSTTMSSVAGALNDEEIAVLAHYLASLPRATE